MTSPCQISTFLNCPLKSVPCGRYIARHQLPQSTPERGPKVAPRSRGQRLRPICMSLLKPVLCLTLPLALAAGLIWIAQQYGRAPLAVIGVFHPPFHSCTSHCIPDWCVILSVHRREVASCRTLLTRPRCRQQTCRSHYRSPQPRPAMSAAMPKSSSPARLASPAAAPTARSLDAFFRRRAVPSCLSGRLAPSGTTPWCTGGWERQG